MDSILDDKELIHKLEQAGLAEALKSDPRWKLLQDCMDRAANKWLDHFLYKMDTRNIADVESVRAMIRIYKYDLFRGLEILKAEGEVAFEELKFKQQFRQSEPQSDNVSIT